MKDSELHLDFVKFVRDIYATNDTIPLHAPRFEGSENTYVLNALESTFVSSVGEYVRKFEENLKDFTGANWVVATNNGTAALHIALLLGNVASGDEVITQPLTFVATCNAIRYCGADPVLIDVERETLGMSPDSLLAFLEDCAEIRDDGLCWNRNSNRIIRACVPVHNLGHPARATFIREICDKYNVFLIEDAAESLGSLSKGVHTGRIGRIGILSFNGNKIITTGGGGALITDDEILALRAKHLITTAKKDHPWLFKHTEVGYNYRLPSLNAALGCAQMEQLADYVDRKRVLALRYRNWFHQRKDEAEFFIEPEGCHSNYWLNAILLQNRRERDSFLRYTNNSGVMTRPMWTPMHTLPMYRDCAYGDLPIAEDIEEKLVNIPSSPI